MIRFHWVKIYHSGNSYLRGNRGDRAVERIRKYRWRLRHNGSTSTLFTDSYNLVLRDIARCILVCIVEINLLSLSMGLKGMQLESKALHLTFISDCSHILI